MRIDAAGRISGAGGIGLIDEGADCLHIELKVPSAGLNQAGEIEFETHLDRISRHRLERPADAAPPHQHSIESACDGRFCREPQGGCRLEGLWRALRLSKRSVRIAPGGDSVMFNELADQVRNIKGVSAACDTDDLGFEEAKITDRIQFEHEARIQPDLSSLIVSHEMFSRICDVANQLPQSEGAKAARKMPVAMADPFDEMVAGNADVCCRQADIVMIAIDENVLAGPLIQPDEGHEHRVMKDRRGDSRVVEHVGWHSPVLSLPHGPRHPC